MENYIETIETLNDLIAINNDRIMGYEKAIKETTDADADLKRFFMNRIDESRRFKLQLGTEVEVLGKDIENAGTMSGRLHRTWLQVKEAFSSHSRHNVLEECEFGEDAIDKAYRDALNSENLPNYIRQIIYDQQTDLISAHDEVKYLRDHVS